MFETLAYIVIPTTSIPFPFFRVIPIFSGITHSIRQLIGFLLSRLSDCHILDAGTTKQHDGLNYGERNMKLITCSSQTTTTVQYYNDDDDENNNNDK